MYKRQHNCLFPQGKKHQGTAGFILEPETGIAAWNGGGSAAPAPTGRAAGAEGKGRDKPTRPEIWFCERFRVHGGAVLSSSNLKKKRKKSIKIMQELLMPKYFHILARTGHEISGPWAASQNVFQTLNEIQI